MSDVSVTRLTIPVISLVGVIGVTAAAVWIYDELRDRIVALESRMNIETRVAALENEIPALWAYIDEGFQQAELQRLQDKLSEAQAAVNFWESQPAFPNLNERDMAQYRNRQSEVKTVICKIAAQTGGSC